MAVAGRNRSVKEKVSVLSLKKGVGRQGKTANPSYRKSHLIQERKKSTHSRRWFCFLSETREMNFVGRNCNEEVSAGVLLRGEDSEGKLRGGLPCSPAGRRLWEVAAIAVDDSVWCSTSPSVLLGPALQSQINKKCGRLGSF